MADWAGLDEDGWRLFQGVHRLLLRLAGRIPDDRLTRLRALLADGDLRRLPDAVTVAALGSEVSLTATEVTLLRGVLAASGAAGGEPEGLARVSVSPEGSTEGEPEGSPEGEPAGGYRFGPVSADVLASAGGSIPSPLDLTGGDPGDLTDLPVGLADLADLADDLTDWTDDRVVGLLARYGAVLGVWRAWRYGPTEQRRVYVVEVEPEVPAWDLTLDLQRALAGADLAMVEVYWAGEALPAYQRAAQANAALLWAGRSVQGELRPAG